MEGFCLGFETERLSIHSIKRSEGMKILEVLLADHELAAQVSWLDGTSPAEVHRQLKEVEAQVESGKVSLWSVAIRDLATLAGAVLVRNAALGIEVEVLISSQFWDEKIIDEASRPVMDWLYQHSSETEPGLLH